jgi:chromosome segregation protein
VSRLRELRLHGFKSFADPTRFVFEPGVNAVIGPNGSGKSNMADAVRWVLGEQSNRSLRTRRADDVIFAGSEQRKPQGMAEAILTLDNADGWLPIEFAEVSVGRRAYRSGETEYLINGARARLRDVVELLGEGRLGANELVVVGQGTVDAALSLRPEERRQLFEEAAGVKNLQVRRNEASARLVRAADNLTRVSDLIGELKPQVRRLGLQAEHQQQHATLGRRARALVQESHRRAERAARDAVGEARRRAAATEAALEAFRTDREAGRIALSEAERRYWAADEAAREAAGKRESTHEALIRAEGRLEALEARQQELQAGLRRADEELGRARTEAAHLASGEPDDALDPALSAAAASEERWRSAIATLAGADAALLAAEEELANLRRTESEAVALVGRRGEERARAAARRKRTEAELMAVSTRRRAAAVAARAATEARRIAEAARETAHVAFEQAATDREAAQGRADETGQHATELSERTTATRAELAALEEQARHAGRLGAALAAAGWSPLLDALSAPDDAWPAIEAIVGGELEQALLWRDADLASAVAEGRGTVRLLAAGADDIGRAEALAAVHAQRTLADWVGSGAPALFHRAAIARDLGALLDGWRRLPAGWCAVTPGGDLADARGVLVIRGGAEPPAGVAARQYARRRELADAVAALERAREAATVAAHEMAERLRHARDAHIAARERFDAAEGLARRRRSEDEAAASTEGRLAAEADRLQADLVAATPAAADEAAVPEGDVDKRLAQLSERADSARRDREEAAAARDAARDAWAATRARAEAAELRSAGQRQARAAAEARTAQLEGEAPRLRLALEAMRAEHEQVRAQVARSHAADRVAAAARIEADDLRERLRAELLELERSAGGTAAELAELERAAHAAAIEASRREEVLVGLGREQQLALESLGAEPGAHDEPDRELLADLGPLDDDTLGGELRSVRRTLAQIGSVNPFAIEEHAELSARLEDLTGQDRDLRAAIASTEELIARLDDEIGEQFDRAFRAIGARFDEYCKLLFAGGSASLQLGDETDGEAPGGIEIVVRPPGKRLQRLAMLSGGERALTGVALLFAMLSVNPVPFCILDEVDAALDEANIGRFADALRRLADEIDFVVITHNRATIEVADTIYGVTMTDAAVSRVLSLRLADLPIEVGA